MSSELPAGTPLEVDELGGMMPNREEEPRLESAKAMIGAYLKAARSTRLYPAHSRVLQEMMEDFSNRLREHVNTWGETDLRIREFQITWGQDILYEEQVRGRSLAFRLFVNGVRQMTFLPGVRNDEADGVVEVLTRSLDQSSGTDDLRTTVWEKCFEHVHFVIIDDLFSDADEKAYEKFRAKEHYDPASARTTRAHTDQILAGLGELPALEGDSPLQLAPEALTMLCEQVQGEMDRDLFEELSDFLMACFHGPEGAAVQQQLEEFLEHLVATGHILRAARVLGSLRLAASRATDPARRKVLQDTLDRLAKARVIPQLRPLLPDLIDTDKQALFRLVTALGEPAIAPLCDILDTKDRDGALEALMVLAPQYPRSLLQFLNHPKPNIVRVIVEVIGKTAGADMISSIMPCLHHEDVGVRREALRAVTVLGGKKALELFIKALADKSYEVRSLAIAALGEYPDLRGSRALLQKIDQNDFLSSSEYEKRETFRSLGRIATPDVIVKLVKVLGTKSLMRRAKQDEVRGLAASALALVGTTAAVHALQQHARDKSDHVRRAVSGALLAIEKAQREQGG